MVVFENVALGYSGKIVLENLNLSLCKGETIALLGCSGAGKTTLISSLTGQMPLLNGEIRVNGVKLNNKIHPVGLVPQISNEITTNLSVAELISLGSPKKGLFTSRAEKLMVNDLIDKLELKKLKDKTITELSGGQRQRVMIARALHASSSLLICDEPTSGADPVLTNEIISLLKQVARNGAMVMVATHDISSVARKFDKIVGIAQGQLVYFGPPENFGPDELQSVYGKLIKEG